MNKNELKIIASLDHVKYRKKYGLFLVEGTHVIGELLKSPWEIEYLVAAHEATLSEEVAALLETAARRNVKVESVAARDFSRLATTEAPQGILAVVRLPRNNPGQLRPLKRVIVADGVSDPGNLGTIARTALAFGFEGLATTPGSADLFNPKTVRSSQGALFSLKLAGHIESDELLKVLKPGFKLYALTAASRAAIDSVGQSDKIALVVGAEIAGVGKAFLEAADFRLKIPMAGPVESLNAAVAAAIAMYEISRPGKKP